uniref:Putative homing endonuclease n=1 Tax=viral metagenome TaxID=1070528 RepID=A0A6M3JR62_9ZZZZ
MGKMIFQDREDMSYLAGLVDGEGCFYLATVTSGKGFKSYQPRIIVTNTNKDVMDWLKDTFGGYITSNKPRDIMHKKAYQWTITGNRALMLANWLEPLLIIKRKEVAKLYINGSG